LSEIPPPYFKYYCYDCNFATRFPEGAEKHSLDKQHFVSSRKPHRDTMIQRKLERYTPRAVRNAQYVYDESYRNFNPSCKGGKCD